MTLCVLSGWMIAQPVWADDVQVTGFDEDAMPELAQPEQARDEWHFIAGAGLASLPRYEGATQHHVRPVPLLEASNGGFFAGTLGGIGYRFVKERDLQFGVRIGAAPGRKESVDPHLAGMGDLKASGEAGLFLKAKFGQGYFNGKVSGGSRGSRAELGTGLDFRVSDADILRMGVSANWATANYMQTYFGVSAAQSATSGLPEYAAAGGIRNYGFGVSWSHIFSRHWLGNLAVADKRIAGSARNSPLAQSESSSSVSGVMIYLF
jgi:outer membrane scaffolding protein for murein synthesis (MipA/OmpV family)